MNQPAYFHITANGADVRHFITCEAEYYAVFNLIGVCAANCPEVIVVSFSIEDSHPHILVWGIREKCAIFISPRSRELTAKAKMLEGYVRPLRDAASVLRAIGEL